MKTFFHKRVLPLAFNVVVNSAVLVAMLIVRLLWGKQAGLRFGNCLLDLVEYALGVGHGDITSLTILCTVRNGGAVPSGMTEIAAAPARPEVIVYQPQTMVA